MLVNKDIEKILLMIRDMQEMLEPDDELSNTLSEIRHSKISMELSIDDLDNISAAGEHILNDNDDF